jgi:hypothetical protein
MTQSNTEKLEILQIVRNVDLNKPESICFVYGGIWMVLCKFSRHDNSLYDIKESIEKIMTIIRWGDLGDDFIFAVNFSQHIKDILCTCTRKNIEVV